MKKRQIREGKSEMGGRRGCIGVSNGREARKGRDKEVEGEASRRERGRGG